MVIQTTVRAFKNTPCLRPGTRYLQRRSLYYLLQTWCYCKVMILISPPNIRDLVQRQQRRQQRRHYETQVHTIYDQKELFQAIWNTKCKPTA